MSTPEPSSASLAAKVTLALRKELPKRVTRNWAEILLGLVLAASIVLAIAAGRRTHFTYVLIHDIEKGTAIHPDDDLVKARLPKLDGVLGSGDDVENLVAASDLTRWSALRSKDVQRLPARGPVIGKAARDLAPFVLLQKGDVAFCASVRMPAVLVRPVAKGGTVRAQDVMSVALQPSQVVGSYRVICGPMRPIAGTRVLLVSGGKEGGDAIDATLLALQTSGEVSTAVVAIGRDAALKLGKEGAEPIHLLQSMGGTP